VLRQTGVDEIHQGKKDKFPTVVCGLQTGEPLWFGGACVGAAMQDRLRQVPKNDHEIDASPQAVLYFDAAPGPFAQVQGTPPPLQCGCCITAETKKILVFTDYVIGFCRRRTLQDAIIVRVFLHHIQRFGRRHPISD
jgi:hypothetical protein